jgi:hypothetical protein
VRVASGGGRGEGGVRAAPTKCKLAGPRRRVASSRVARLGIGRLPSSFLLPPPLAGALRGPLKAFISGRLMPEARHQPLLVRSSQGGTKLTVRECRGPSSSLSSGSGLKRALAIMRSEAATFNGHFSNGPINGRRDL